MLMLVDGMEFEAALKQLVKDLIGFYWSEKSGFRYINSGAVRVLIGLKISV
ncbi:MAG: hypothetical protein ACR2NK_20205 [Mariniblastus sp.]